MTAKAQTEPELHSAEHEADYKLVFKVAVCFPSPLTFHGFGKPWCLCQTLLNFPRESTISHRQSYISRRKRSNFIFYSFYLSSSWSDEQSPLSPSYRKSLLSNQFLLLVLSRYFALEAAADLEPEINCSARFQGNS